MTTLLLAFGAMLIIIGGMAVGVIFGRQPIKGSCGGMSAVGIDAECEICGGNPARCDAQSDSQLEEPLKEQLKDQDSDDLSYRA